jgi:biopolymer transport protein ExbD
MTVDGAGVIRVNHTILKKEEIAARLPRLMAGAQQKVLYFDAADQASYGTAIEAMDLSRASGIKTIAILTEKVAP